MKPSLTASLIAVAVVLASSLAMASESWRSARDDAFGFRFAYPEALFSSLQSDRPSFHYFVSDANDAKFVVGAWVNEQGRTPQQWKDWMLSNGAGYEDVTYEPRGRNWFVVSGYRGDQIYYEKVMFTCGGGVANVLAIAYPKAKRDLFDAVVERMEDEFKPGAACGS